MSKIKIATIISLAISLTAAAACAQTPSTPATNSAAASTFAQLSIAWMAPFPPHRVNDNVYYVGSKELAVFLITTPEGHVLINSNLEQSVPQIRENGETRLQIQ
jgi:hypothetical protein